MDISNIDYSERIPNNVDLRSDRRLQRALGALATKLLGLVALHEAKGFQEDHVYLRTAISVDAKGWAHFDYVKMPDYRWGIFLTPSE